MDSTLISMLQRRVDKAIIDVIFEIPHAAYYLFDELEKVWKKGDIEGPLLLVKRSQEPYFYITILNKQTLSNFHQPVSMEAQFDKKMPQLLYIRDRNKGVYGIWSPSADLLDQLLNKLGEVQHIDSQSRMLKSLLDIGGESSLIANSRSPDSISEPKQQEFREPKSQEYRETKQQDYREPKQQEYRENKQPEYREPKQTEYREPKQPEYREQKQQEYREQKQPEFREPKQQEFKPAAMMKQSEENILKPEFFQKGIQFEDEETSSLGREKLKEAIVALANSDEFLDLVLQALRSKGFN